MPAFDAVLNASVLFPASLRDTLLPAAAAGLYRLRWTDEILEEVRRNFAAQRLTDEQAQRRITRMRTAFPEALVTSYSERIPTMTNDPKDRHALAAAVAAKARVIVTTNLAGFPPAALAPLGVEAQSPDSFLSDLLTLDSESGMSLLAEQAADLRRPPKTLLELLDTLTQHAPVFITIIRNLLEAAPPDPTREPPPTG